MTFASTRTAEAEYGDSASSAKLAIERYVGSTQMGKRSDLVLQLTRSCIVVNARSSPLVVVVDKAARARATGARERSRRKVRSEVCASSQAPQPVTWCNATPLVRRPHLNGT